MLDYEQIDRMAHIISDWMNDITVPTDVPVMAICYCMEALMELLKEQEAIEPIEAELVIFGSNRTCSSCKKRLFPAGRYCPHCGRLVKWDD